MCGVISEKQIWSACDLAFQLEGYIAILLLHNAPLHYCVYICKLYSLKLAVSSMHTQLNDGCTWMGLPNGESCTCMARTWQRGESTYFACLPLMRQ